MAKGKNLNPADAYRKAQRKKELKKNKAERTKARNFALVKKDTRDLEDEIEKLEANAELSAAEKSRLAGLQNELSKITEKKEEYIKEHPEHRKLVYRARRQEKDQDLKEPPPAEQKRNLFNKHGLPRHPERSIYYDPVMNPYGVPPPGMPYIERPLSKDEAVTDEDLVDSDEDIVMPEGPPPGPSVEDSDSDDDIPMPEGPPPDRTDARLDLSSQAPPGIAPLSLPPPPHMSFDVLSSGLPPPLPPLSFNDSVYPSLASGMSPPLPPPGFFPRRIQPTAAIQDPLSSIPHQTYQAHRTSQLPLGHPSLPPKPSPGVPGGVPGSAGHTSAVISAEPELRDLKKEATSFVPASLRRKKPSGAHGSSKVNPAPSVNVDSESPSLQTRPDLVGVLKNRLGAVATPPLNGQVSDKGSRATSVKERDDYQTFVDEMNDLLGPPGSS